MNGHSLGYIYGWGLALFAITILPPLTVAIAEAEQAALAGFLVTSIGSAFTGVALIIALKGNLLEINRREKLLLIVGLWVTFCLLSAIPFEASGIIKGRVDAIFEATSGLTTTGATLLEEITTLPKSIILWRAQLNWMGGFLTLFTITFAIIRILGADHAAQGLYKSNPQKSDNALHFISSFRLVLPVYVGLTALSILGLMISGIPSFDAICLAMSTISTGGFMPRDGSFSTYGSIPAMYVLSLTMFLGAVSVLWLNFLIKQDWSALKKNNEPLWVGFIIIALAIMTLGLKYQFNEGTDFLGLNREFATSLMNAASLISTTGMVANSNAYSFISPALILIAIIVGGGVLSTSGGIKFTRVILMFRQSKGELRSLIYPHEVRPLYLTDEETDYKYLSTIWVIFALSILLIIALAGILGFYGFGLEAALFASVSALSNCGPCYSQVAQVHIVDAPSLIPLAQPAKISLIAAMIIGRLEFLVAISLFNISFWRH